MIAHRARDFSPVLALLLPLILVANGHGFGNGTVIPENQVDVNLSNVSSSVINHKEDKMEARSDGDSSINRSVERKNGGPFSYRRDSYLEALRHSRTSTDPREGIVDVVGTGSGSFHRRKEQSLGPVYTKRSEIPASSSRIVHVDRDSFSMVPSDSYSLPSRTSVDFNAVKNTYGPPQPSYGPPSYGPPSYGPPSSSNDYSSYGEYGANGGGYSPHQPQQAYGAPHGMSESVQLSLPSIDFSWPFALKLNAFTLAKILLKLVIFKMIVKFIAVICLLLFIPKLEIKKGDKGNNMQNEDDEDEGRRFLNANSIVWDRLNRLTLVVHDAMKQYGVNMDKPRSSSDKECSSTLQCQIRRAFEEHDESWPDYEQLLQNYIMEETRLIQEKS
ncbi:uncharacterized protein LOC122713016 isoform X2 [Apis laboriosa]|uniref:uncharacterized protein LOC122713016 isoform X2 n=1 Tax=Apis laboriosa TaxID=183418 RepID=UPI001CC4E20F|nr:uncharacterized protein LOC122713016 isoform X2 [Apis laboriosa]